MELNTRATVIAALTMYARKNESLAACDMKNASGKILAQEAGNARRLISLLEHGSALP